MRVEGTRVPALGAWCPGRCVAAARGLPHAATGLPPAAELPGRAACVPPRLPSANPVPEESQNHTSRLNHVVQRVLCFWSLLFFFAFCAVAVTGHTHRSETKLTAPLVR